MANKNKFPDTDAGATGCTRPMSDEQSAHFSSLVDHTLTGAPSKVVNITANLSCPLVTGSWLARTKAG